MLDIGWTELLVIAVVLIVVVGPKDLPPMLRAFGKMMTNFRKMAGEFRTQFDDALRESEMDDVRKTISDAQKLNPTNALRDAMNPLRQMGQDIKADLQKATQPPSALAANATDLAPTDAEAQQAVESAQSPVAGDFSDLGDRTPGKPAVAGAAAASASAATASAATTAVVDSKPAVPAAAVTAAAAEPAPVAPPAKPARKTVAKAVKPAADGAVTEAAKPKPGKAAPKKATAAAEPPKAPARKRATKKSDTPKDDA
jgi:sec-independent protein translocase protein TatB